VCDDTKYTYRMCVNNTKVPQACRLASKCTNVGYKSRHLLRVCDNEMKVVVLVISYSVRLAVRETHN